MTGYAPVNTTEMQYITMVRPMDLPPAAYGCDDCGRFFGRRQRKVFCKTCRQTFCAICGKEHACDGGKKIMYR